MVQNDISIGFLNYLCNWTCAWDGTIFAPLALCNHIMKWWLTIARRVRIGKEYLGRYQVAVPILSTTFYLKMGPPRPLFVYFRSFQTQIVQKKLEASNSDCQSISRARWPHDHHHTIILSATCWQYFAQENRFVNLRSAKDGIVRKCWDWEIARPVNKSFKN